MLAALRIVILTSFVSRIHTADGHAIAVATFIAMHADFQQKCGVPACYQQPLMMNQQMAPTSDHGLLITLCNGSWATETPSGQPDARPQTLPPSASAAAIILLGGRSVLPKRLLIFVQQ